MHSSETGQLVMLLPGGTEPALITDRIGSGEPLISTSVLTISGRLTRRWREEAPGAEVFQLDQLTASPPTDCSKTHVGGHAQLLDRLLEDHRTALIVAREWAPGFIDTSLFNLMPRLSELTWHVFACLQRRQPTAIIMRSTPHLVVPWVIAKCADHLQIPVLISTGAVLPGQARMVKGVDQQETMSRSALGEPAAVAADVIERGVDEFISEQRSTYSTAGPPAHRSALKRSAHGGWSALVEWRELERRVRDAPRPKHAIPRASYGLRTSASRLRLWRSYQQHVSRDVGIRPSVTLFLHYQPERTTLPEAGRFGYQLEFARLLAYALPEGWLLRVREHPATFVGPGPFNPGFRSPELYRALARLPRTVLSELDTDPFALIDASQAVATCTGTVGIESLVRGTPVIIAGAAAYRDAPGVLNLRQHSGVEAEAVAHFCQRLAGSPEPVDGTALRAYLREQAADSFASSYGVWSRHSRASEEAHSSALAAALATAARPC